MLLLLIFILIDKASSGTKAYGRSHPFHSDNSNNNNNISDYRHHDALNNDNNISHDKHEDQLNFPELFGIFY